MLQLVPSTAQQFHLYNLPNGKTSPDLSVSVVFKLYNENHIFTRLLIISFLKWNCVLLNFECSNVRSIVVRLILWFLYEKLIVCLSKTSKTAMTNSSDKIKTENWLWSNRWGENDVLFDDFYYILATYWFSAYQLFLMCENISANLEQGLMQTIR